ncbi:hypothetical protein [Halolamina salina]|uniref:DUF4231 domain-containing protein n=1 Tax=Halolamina salina TaxID=1220023 RepID=A0ABD6B121_9EURY
MTNDSENEEPDGFSREELIGNRLLHTEYEQAGEEYRYRDRLLHNSYYLLIVVTALLAGPLLQYIGQDGYLKLGVIVLLAGGLYTLLGLVMLTHYVQRNSASFLRTRVEQVADGTKERIPRPFAIQYRVIGQDTRMTDEHELDKARPFFSRVLGMPENLHSAETLAQAVLVVGFTLIVAGVAILTSTWPFIYNLASAFGAFVAVGVFVLGLRNIGSDLEFR